MKLIKIILKSTFLIFVVAVVAYFGSLFTDSRAILTPLVVLAFLGVKQLYKHFNI